MYTPINTPLFASITPITTIDLSLNAFLHVSWMILLPYTFLGLGLMVYSQGKLMRGERELRRQDKLEVPAAATIS